MLRIALPFAAFLVLTAASLAQRPTATFIGGSLVRLDLGGFRLFADAPVDGPEVAIGQEDVALYVTEPSQPSAGGRTFMPSMEGELLDRRTERLGEKTGIYVHARSTPLDGTPHYSYLVQWSGRRMYFSGATTDPTDLLGNRELDIAFVTPALLKAVQQAGGTIDTKTVYVYHLTEELPEGAEMKVPCERCKVVIPKPGETITLFR